MLIKLIFFITFVFSIQIEYNTLQNEPIYFLENNVWNKLYFNINKNYTLELLDVEPWYGYINNPCLKSYSCCKSNVSLTKHFNKNNCSNILMSSCNGFIAQNSECYDSFHCERYNSTTYIKYLLSLNTMSDIKCFFKYKLIETNIKIDTNLLNYTINDNFTDTIIEYQIEGVVLQEKNITHSFFKCDKQNHRNINKFFYNTYLFKEFDDMIKTEYVDCRIDENIIYHTNFFDKNNEKYNSLNYINGKITNNIIQTQINKTLILDFSNDIVIKKVNKGCFINNIEKNNHDFNFFVNCMEDEFQYINFTIVYENPDKTYSFRDILTKNDYSFYLDSYRSPSYFINHISEKNIRIDYKNTTNKINTINNFKGDENFVQSPQYTSQLTIIVLTYSIILLIMIIVIIFIILLNKKILVPSKHCGFRFNEPSYEKLIQMIEEKNPKLKLSTMKREKQLEILSQLWYKETNEEIQINKQSTEGSYKPDEKYKQDYRKRYKNSIENKKYTDKEYTENPYFDNKNENVKLDNEEMEIIPIEENNQDSEE